MLSEDIRRLPELTNVGLALVELAESLIPGTAFQPQGRRWVARPSNFVTFEVHQRAHNITLSLRGAPTEFRSFKELELKSGMGRVYSECKITRTAQLEAATSYVVRAAELFRRGRNRVRTQPIVREVFL